MPVESAIWAVVPAAGVGQRMQSDRPKQYLTLAGLTVLELTVQSLLKHPVIQHIVVCTHPKDHYWSSLSSLHTAEIEQVMGGESRAQSVFNGLQALEGKASEKDWVIVHDAARPCLTQACLTAFIDALKEDEVGGLLAIPSKDTLKKATTVDGVIRVSSTLDRSVVWRAQTPQMFRFGLLKKALKIALEEQIEITDEASAVEYAGYQPRLITGEENNLKITTPDDLALAQKLLKSE